MKRRATRGTQLRLRFNLPSLGGEELWGENQESVKKSLFRLTRLASLLPPLSRLIRDSVVQEVNDRKQYITVPTPPHPTPSLELHSRSTVGKGKFNKWDVCVRVLHIEAKPSQRGLRAVGLSRSPTLCLVRASCFHG